MPRAASSYSWYNLVPSNARVAPPRLSPLHLHPSLPPITAAIASTAVATVVAPAATAVAVATAACPPSPSVPSPSSQPRRGHAVVAATVAACRALPAGPCWVSKPKEPPRRLHKNGHAAAINRAAHRDASCCRRWDGRNRASRRVAAPLSPSTSARSGWCVAARWEAALAVVVRRSDAKGRCERARAGTLCEGGAMAARRRPFGEGYKVRALRGEAMAHGGTA
jgi:hypothetical protein